MRNIFILCMPTLNYEALVYYQDTIKNKVEQKRIFKYLNPEVRTSTGCKLVCVPNLHPACRTIVLIYRYSPFPVYKDRKL